jgi:oxygen-independent coproporphyrinogen III oxidase
METSAMTDPHSVQRHYLDALKGEIDHWASKKKDDNLYTIYIGGGTPTSLGADGLMELIDHVGSYRDLEEVAELTIECNPDPIDEMLSLIKQVSKHYHKLPRVRRNIGVQTFDDEILEESRRDYTFNELVGFLRSLQKIKQWYMSYNLDFIAFGKLKELNNQELQLRNATKLQFFDDMVGSGVFDSFSIYTLELFPGSTWYEQRKHLTDHTKEWYGMKQYGSDDDVYAEFSLLKDILLSHGYQRYELSNFAITGRQSIHNHVYRSMDEYVGAGTSASGLVRNDEGHLMRYTNTRSLKDYLAEQYVDEDQTIVLEGADELIEWFFLALRTSHGITDLERYESVLIDDYQQKIDDLIEQWFVQETDYSLRLTDQGMDVYNEIVTSLLKKI